MDTSDTKRRSVYWKRPSWWTKESPLWNGWKDPTEAPRDGSLILARIKGSNRAVAVSWDATCNGWRQSSNGIVEITQWKTFEDFASAQACQWKGMP